MSDIGILNDPWSVAFVLLILGAPGMPVGALAGAVLWRRHRLLGALGGAVLGFTVCLLGVMLWKDLI